MEKFADKVAVITGAAGGIGLALARRAHAQGMKLVLADIDEERLQGAAREAGFDTGRLLTRGVDVSKAEEIAALADAAYERFGAVHLLCNNAGVAMTRMSWEMSEADWEWVLGVNLWSVIHGVRLFLPRMMAQGGPAHVVNTASAAGLISHPGSAAYNISKHGIVAFSETLYMELRTVDSPVNVSVLCPAWVPTDINRSLRVRPDRFGEASAMGEASAKLDARIGQAISGGRLSADDIADHVFKAVESDQFYVIPHRRINGMIEKRFEAILKQTNPLMP